MLHWIKVNCLFTSHVIVLLCYFKLKFQSLLPSLYFDMFYSFSLFIVYLLCVSRKAFNHGFFSLPVCSLVTGLTGYPASTSRSADLPSSTSSVLPPRWSPAVSEGKEVAITQIPVTSLLHYSSIFRRCEPWLPALSSSLYVHLSLFP